MSEPQTFLKLYRSILDWGWYGDIAVRSVFLHLLLSANWEDGEYFGTEIKKGEVLFGRKKYAEALGLSEQQVRTAIKKLHKTGEISTIKVTNKFTVIKIEKWGIFQGKESDSNQQANQRATNEQPTSNHIQEEKKKRIKENTNKYSREIAEIVDYLNQRCGTNYRASTKETRRLITARLNEKYTIEDFYRVIDTKVNQWGNHPKMKDYLRPQTLFGSKFESYANQRPTTGNPFADAVLRGDFDE